ncbi:MAG: class I SAM-dependent methyltransferase [Planctomycetaceae bacterium]
MKNRAFASGRSLQPIEFPRGLDCMPLEQTMSSLIQAAQERIQTFQDRWDQPQMEQFVASDYHGVHRALEWVVNERLMMGNRMVEWGCGFAVVAAIASRLGLDVVGIEAESTLLKQARQTLIDFDTPVDLVCGNFLPQGAEALSHDPDFPSLGHDVENAYELMGLDLDDFALVFGYPWPGEELFHQAVFERYGMTGGLLMLFCGPNDLRLWRKVK